MTDINFSLIDTKTLSKPVCKLIEAVQSAVGIIYEPINIRRKARAESDAAIIKLEGEIKSQDIAQRVSERVNRLEIRRQENIEGIVVQASKELPEAVDEQPVNEDWIAQFFNLSQDISDSEMQILWARILAGEVARPESYSLRTLQTVKVLSKGDARLFSQYCSYVWQLRGNTLCHYRTDETDSHIASKGIGGVERKHLQDLGLMNSSDVGMRSSSYPYTVLSSRDKPFEATYFGRRYLVKQFLDPNESAIILPEFLTDIGSQLFTISGAQPDEQFIAVLVESLKKEKIQVAIKS
jgi:hypothetical protein